MNRNLTPGTALRPNPVGTMTACLLSPLSSRKTDTLMVYQVPVVPRSGIRHVHSRVRSRSGRAKRLDANGPDYWPAADALVEQPDRARGKCQAWRCVSPPTVSAEKPRRRFAAAVRYGPKVMANMCVKIRLHRRCGQTAVPRDVVPAGAPFAGLCVPHPNQKSGNPRLAPPSAAPLRHWALASRLAAVRRINGQQNAHRRDPSGGNSGGRSARQSCRGIRLRVRQP